MHYLDLQLCSQGLLVHLMLTLDAFPPARIGSGRYGSIQSGPKDFHYKEVLSQHESGHQSMDAQNCYGWLLIFWPHFVDRH